MYSLSVSLVNEDTETIFAEFVEDLDDSLLVEDNGPDMGAVYRAARSEYGRCLSSVYADRRAGGPPKRIGWYFVKRDRYEDDGKPYLRGAWVSVIERVPETRHYVEL